MKAALTLLAALSLAAFSLTSCKLVEEKPAPEAATPATSLRIKVEDATVRISVNPNAPSVAYFTIVGGPEADTLTGVSSPEAGRVEMHNSIMRDGMVAMIAMNRVEIPAGERVSFRPGGLHAMLFDVASSLRDGGKLHLNLTFKNAGIVAVEITIPRTASAPAPAAIAVPAIEPVPRPRPPLPSPPSTHAPHPAPVDAPPLPAPGAVDPDDHSHHDH